MSRLPGLVLSPTVQLIVVIVAGVALVSYLGFLIWRAIRRPEPINVPVGASSTDPNTPAEDLPTEGQIQADGSAIASGGTDSAEPDKSMPRTPEPVTPQTVVSHESGGNFVKVWPHQLAKITVVAQALDNQWLTRAMLVDMQRSFARGKSLGLADLHDTRRRSGRAEYIRALLNAQQLVTNRVFLYNTDYVAEDYFKPGDARGAFIDLLNAGVIVPFLVKEHDPSEPPASVETAPTFEDWQQVCRDANVHATRLDWDDTLNERENRMLQGRFALWLGGMDMIHQYGDLGVLARQLGLPPEQTTAFQNRLRDVSRWTHDQNATVYRGAFYKEFVTAPGTAVTDGIIDFDASSKPFAAELKQLADLSYATNLPDALGRYALTPMDSLPRTVLQELNISLGRQGRIITEADLNTLLRREAFALMNGGMFLKSMSELTLRDVIELRATDEWAAYIREMQGLLDQPLEFEQRSQHVYDRYVDLAGRVTDVARKRGGADLLERWSPVVKLVLTLGTSSLSMWWNPFQPGLAGKILFNVTEGAVGQVANLTARLIIGGVADRRAEAELETSLDFLRGRVEGARDAWTDIVGRLRSDPQYEDRSKRPEQSQDEFDPNINYSEHIEGMGNG